MLPNFSRGLKWNPVRSQKPSSFFLNKFLYRDKKKKMLKTYFAVSHMQSWMTMSVFNPLQWSSWGIKPLFLTYVLILAVVELRAALVWMVHVQARLALTIWSTGVNNVLKQAANKDKEDRPLNDSEAEFWKYLVIFLEEMILKALGGFKVVH